MLVYWSSLVLQRLLQSSRISFFLVRSIILSLKCFLISLLMNEIGIGHFTILDSEKVTPRDAGNNFFLHHTSIGKPRGPEAVRFLAELNDSVEGIADTSVC